MEKLQRLIKALKPGEVQLIEDFYKVKNGGNTADNKRLQLFKLLVEGKVKNNEEAAHLLYHKKCNSALSHLKKRLEEDILNFLLIDFSDCGLSEATREELHCNKMLLQGKMLIAKGIWEEGVSLLEKTSQLSEKYEFPDISLASADILRTYSSRNYQHYNVHIEKCVDAYQKLLKAKGVTLKLSHQFDITKPEKSLANVFTKRIKGNNPGSSKEVMYWHKMALLQFYKNEHDFEHAKNYALEILESLRDEPKVFSDFKFAQVNLELAQILIYLKEYTNALVHAEIVIKLFPYCSLEYLQGLLVCYFANFRSGKLGKAEAIVNTALKHPLVKNMLKSRWVLLNAALMFSQKKFSIVNRMLYTQHTGKNDITWEIGSKILEVLTILETEDFDWFEFKIESFRKKVQSIRDKSYGRLKIFYNILKTLTRNNYNYKETIAIEKQNLELLMGNQPLLSWDPMGYELINTRDWILNKAQ